MKHNWEYKTLQDVCVDFVVPQRDKPTAFDGDIPWCRIEDIEGRFLNGSKTNQLVTKELADSMNMHICPKGTVICACSATIGKQAITTVDCYTNQTFIGIISDPRQLYNVYLYHFLNSQTEQLKKMGTGATIKYISKKKIESLTIPVPPLAIQEQIVAELDKVSEIIEKKKQQVKELDNLAQSIFYDMFGDPVENEKGWEVKKLGEECSELRYGTSRPAVENGKYGYLRMGNLTISGHLDLSDLKYIDIPENEIEKCLVRKGDVMFNRTNSLELIGKTCLFDLDEPMVIAGYIIRVRLKTTLHPRYVVSLFNIQTMKNVLRKMAKGAVNQANINSKELSSINIPIPPLSLQQSFAQKIEAIEKQKELITASIKEMQTLFDSRMEYYFG